MSEQGEQAPASNERIALSSEDAALRRKRTISGSIAVLLLAAAAGGITGLIGGQTAGLVAAAVIGLPLLYILAYTARRRLWLEGNTLIVRTWGTRRIDLATVKRIDLLITEVRATRTVALMVQSERGSAVKIDLAAYSDLGGRELGVFALRKLANALMNNTDANGMVFSELLVAQLRAEAREESADARPLYRLASAAPTGKLAQRYTMEAVSRFVASLE